MLDKISKTRRSWNMSRIKSSDTALELKVRKYLFSKGFRYRIHYRLVGKPDIVFPANKIAVFVNGCFWHLHGCSLSKIPSSRTKFWEQKLKRNRERDAEVAIALDKLGWTVIQLWECEINSDFNHAMEKLTELLLLAKCIRAA